MEISRGGLTMRKWMLVCVLVSLFVAVVHDQGVAGKKEAHPTLIQERVIPKSLDSEARAERAAQNWLKSLNYNLTLDRMRNLKTLRLQMYGSINGVSTQVLISNANMVHLKVLNNLETLALPTWTNDAGLSNVAGLVRLTTLNIPNSRITDAGMAFLKNLREMKSLVLTAANITDSGIEYLAGLSRLEILNLSNTRLTDAGMVHIAGLTNLRKLFLNRTGISDNSVPHILKLRNLERLDITGTRITHSGRRQIRNGIPGIELH
ncbi:MAG: hypothetical protein JRJ26_12055 [Deltaproteobacteria bacterium]|nr:hypothetical protein [Deltaproteobacteria bacterium]